MKQLERDETKEAAGGLDLRNHETEVSPDATTSEPAAVIDYNPPVQPQ